MIKNNNNVCKNCGKTGHLFHQCKLPITSYGIILFRSSTKGLQFLMIRRKDSFGYIDFIRGKYSPYNIEQIQNIVNQMSVQEKNRIISENFDSLWKNMWNNTSSSQYKNEELMSLKKFETIKNGVFVNYENNNNDSFMYETINEILISINKIEENIQHSFFDDDTKTKITLEDIVKNSNTKWFETEWEFPKGRRNYQERDLDCALREFEEETGISKKNITIIENLLPFEEIFIGTNYKSYKHKYFLASYNKSSQIEEDVMENYQLSEVSKMEWKTLEDCLMSIRSYNLEKKQLIQNIYKILQEFNLFEVN